MYACLGNVLQCMCISQKTACGSWLSHSPMWILRVKLRKLSLASSTILKNDEEGYSHNRYITEQHLGKYETL